MISLGSFFHSWLHSGEESICSLIFSCLSDPRVPRFSSCTLAQMDSLQELCRSFLHADKWAAVLRALWALSELWALEGDFDFSLLMGTGAVVPDLVIKFVPTLSLALKTGCGGCLAGAAPKRCPSTRNLCLKYYENWTGQSNPRLQYLLYEM